MLCNEKFCIMARGNRVKSRSTTPCTLSKCSLVASGWSGQSFTSTYDSKYQNSCYVFRVEIRSKKILSVFEKNFTIEQKFNKQNDKVYAQTLIQAEAKVPRIQRVRHFCDGVVGIVMEGGQPQFIFVSQE